MANNLLDKSSIILTPTAYNNGKALCVKPSDGSGDFDFSRNSAATRVNAQGLVENVQILSSNLVQNPSFSEEGVQEVSNGSFTNGSTDWTLETGWSIAENKAIQDGTGSGNNGDIIQNASLDASKTYKIVLEVTEYTQGTLYVDTANIDLNINGVGTYTLYFSPSSNFLYIRTRYSNFIGSITNISVKEVGMDWFLNDKWSIVDDGVRLVSADTSPSTLTQASVFTIGKTYKITLDAEVVSGASKLEGSGGTAFLTINQTKSYIVYWVADITSLVFNRLTTVSDITITNISVIEITTDTNLPRINYEGFSYQDALGSEEIVNGDFATDSGWDKGAGWTINGGSANSDGTNNNQKLKQTNVLTIGKSYKLSFDLNYVSGLVKFSSSSVLSEYNSSGTYTLNFIADAEAVIFDAFSAFIGSIDNVSVKEYLGQEVVPNSGCGSWLWEPQSTNLITQSEALSTMQSQSTITDNILKSPTGNINASIVVENTALNSHAIQRGNIIPTNPSATSYTLSIFAKKKERQYIQLGFFTDGVFQGSSGFDLENGTTSGDANTHKIIDFGNGWYRCSFTKDLVQSGGYNFARVAIGISSVNFYYTGDGASGLYMFGYQLEQGNISSYIPTSGSQVTRNQDVCTGGGSLATINSTSGVLYFEGAVLSNDGTDRVFSLNSGSFNNRVQIGYTAVSNQLIVIVQSNGAISFNATTTLADATQINKIAVKYSLNNFSLWINGVEAATDTSGNTPVGLNNLDFNISNVANFFGKTKALAVFPYLSDQELTELTTI